MILNEARIGKHLITNSKLLEFLENKLDKKTFFFERKEGGVIYFKATETNVLMLPEKDKRIKQLGRAYLYTHAFLPSQKDTLLDFFSRNNITVTWAKDPKEWILADKVRSEVEEEIVWEDFT